MEFLWKMLEELDIKSRKCEEKKEKSKAKDILEKQIEANKSKGLKKITSFFKPKNKEIDIIKPEDTDMEVDHWD